jgi:Tol biopolymer transport system component
MSPQSSIAHYRITSKLGEGGMGEVWRATDTKLGRDVAIKVIPQAFAQDPDRMARFTREAQVLASLNHPYIAAIYGVEERALIMELVEGPTLAERIAQGPIPPEEALPIARQISEALEYAHEKGIVHRDLKPANIKVTPEGRVKVLDFGLAKALANDAISDDPATSPTLTMRATLAGVIMGTAAYMAPEQARGGAADRRSDIWAFGAVFYEMLTGRQAFSGDTISDVLAAVLRADLDWAALPRETPTPIRRLLRRCLERDRRRRLADISDARLDIDEALAGSQEPEAAAAVPVVRQHARWWIAAAAALAVALAAVSAIHFRETSTQSAAVRFQVPPPAGGAFAFPFMALSPDGRKLAFGATGKGGGQSLLWVRALDSLEARALPGTENGIFPFWSPDGRFLAFSASGKLKKIEASGGPPQTVCNVSTNIAAAGYWNRDGVIFFNDGSDGIFRVPQSGGDPVRVTKPDTAHGEVGHFYPHILPDGRHYLYLIGFAARENNAIYLGSLDGKEKKRLVGTSKSFSYAPPAENGKSGHLLFMREDTLIAQPLDSRTFELAGEGFPVAERVGLGRSYAFFTVSPSGALAYRTGGAAGNRQLTWFDRAGKPLATLGAPADYDDVALSRDGTRAAVMQIDPRTSNPDIWLIDAARETPTRLTFDDAVDWYPVWSPDGSRVAFSSNRDGQFTLYVKDASGAAKEERLQKAESDERPCDWSPDGRFLMFVRGSRGSTQLWLLSDPTGDPAKRQAAPYLETSFNTTQCQFSPGPTAAPRWVAYSSDESKHGSEIYVQSFPPGAGKFQVSSGGGTQPRWRRDGKELFYIAPDGKLMAVDVKTAPRFEAGIPHALFDSRIWIPTSAIAFRYDVTPDGQRFLVNTARQGEAAAAPDAITVVLNWTAGLKR